MNRKGFFVPAFNHNPEWAPGLQLSIQCFCIAPGTSLGSSNTPCHLFADVSEVGDVGLGQNC